MLDVIIDQNTPIYGQFAGLYEKLTGFPTPPIVRGVGITPMPRPERLYFWFGAPMKARARRDGRELKEDRLRDRWKSRHPPGDPASRPHHAIASCAASEHASLVITGSRGMTFVAGLRSVSERVAQSAACSVLVIRRPDAASRDIPYA